jgi:DNA-binding response OmpR family regulator
MDGVALFQRLRRRSTGILGLLMTAYPTLESAIDALHAGLLDYLPKPFTPEQMTAALRAIASRSPAKPAGVHRIAWAIVRAIDTDAPVTTFEE